MYTGQKKKRPLTNFPVVFNVKLDYFKMILPGYFSTYLHQTKSNKTKINEIYSLNFIQNRKLIISEDITN